MSLGSCLVTNEPSGLAEAFIQARVDGKSWKEIADEFSLPNPGAARKAFEKATGIADFKIKGKALKNLVDQGPDAIKAANVAAKEVKTALKAVDDVVEKKPPIADIDLSKHDLDWPEPQKKTIKDKLHEENGWTDYTFDEMEDAWKNGKSYSYFQDYYGLDKEDYDALNKLWHANVEAAKKTVKTVVDVDLDKAWKALKDEGYLDDEIDSIIQKIKGGTSKESMVMDGFIQPKEYDLISGLLKRTKVVNNMDALADLTKVKFQLLKEGHLSENIDKMVNIIKGGKKDPKLIIEFFDITDADYKAIKEALDKLNLPATDFVGNVVKWQDIDLQKPYIKLQGDLPEDLDELQKLGNVLLHKKNDDLYNLSLARADAKKNWEDALKKNDTGMTQFRYKEWIKTNDDYNQFLNDVVPVLDADIAKVTKAIANKPAAIPDIPVNKPFTQADKPAHTPKFKDDKELANATGLTQDQINTIKTMNSEGKGYLAIKDSMPGVEFPQIDEVVWNHLIKEHNGFTWRAYEAKPTSELGFNAVKEKVFEGRKKGLTIDEITSKPGAPPKPVIQAILNDTWKLPSAGAKVPIIPPPPPAPPQVFGGAFPSAGTNFRRHSNDEMLQWIGNDTSLLGQAERRAISNYTNSGYHDINSYLRGGGLSDTSGYGYTGSNVVQQIKYLDSTMRPLPVDITVTRNFTGVHHLPTSPENMVGKVFHDNAFMSTTVKESGVFGGDVQLIINVPQGSMGRYVNDISSHKSEQELILARETRMVVTRVEKHPNIYGGDRWRLFVDVVLG